MRITSEIWDTKFIVGKRGVFSRVCRRERGYGYKNVPIADETRKGSFGKPALIGVSKKSFPNQAEVVEQIMEMRAMGLSFGRIAKNLKAAGNRTGPELRQGRHPGVVRIHIKQVTLNELYRGWRFWTRTQKTFNRAEGEVQRTDLNRNGLARSSRIAHHFG